MDRTLSKVQILKISKKYSTCDSPITTSPPVSLIEIPIKSSQEDDFVKVEFNNMKVNDRSEHEDYEYSLRSSRNRPGCSSSQKLRSRSKSPMNFKNDTEKTSDNENRSSFKGRKRLFKTLSLFSTTQTPIEQIKLDFQKGCTSSNSVRSHRSRNVDNHKRSFGSNRCQDIKKRTEMNMDAVQHTGAEDEECLASSPDSNVHGTHYNDTMIESSDLEVRSILSEKNSFGNTLSTHNKRRNMSDSSTLREVFIDSDIETDIGTFSTNSPLTSNFDRRTSCSSAASDGSYGSGSGTSSQKPVASFQSSRKYSLGGNIAMHHKSRRASVSPTFILSSSNDAIDEEKVFPDKAPDQPRKKPNTAERIEMIRRTLRRQSTSSAPIQPPKHSIMAGFAGFLNMTTATCNTGVPNERRMSIPVVVQDGDSKSCDSPKSVLPYSYLPPIDLSPIYQEEDSTFSSPSLPSTETSSKVNIGKLQTRWSDSNVVLGKRRILKSSESTVNNKSPVKKESIGENSEIKEVAAQSFSRLAKNEKSDNLTYNRRRNRIRSDSLACPDSMLRYKGINRGRNNSDPMVIITVSDGASSQQQTIHRASSRAGRSAIMERVQSFTEKSRTLDFTEFPEGMREYSRSMCRTTSTGSSPTLSPTRIGDHAEMRNRGGRTILRETCSQPVSPQLIPRIEIHDLCDNNFSTGSEPPPTPPSRRQPGVIDYQSSRISSRVSTFQRNSFQKHQEDDIHRKSSGSNNITSIKIQQQEKNSAGNLSHQLSTCSAVSLPSKIDDIGSDNEIGDADDQEYDVNDEDDDDDGFTAYDDEEYDSEGDGRTRSGDEVLNDEIENQQLQRHNYNNGRKSPNRKLGQRGGKLIDHVQSNAAPNQRRRNKVKRRKAYYSRQRRTDIAFLPVMPSSSLPMGGIVYHYHGYSQSANHPFFQNPPGPPPGSPANLQVQAETDLTMGRSKSLTSIDSLSPHSSSAMNAEDSSPRGSGRSRGHGGRAGSVSVQTTKSTGGMERGARSEDLLGVEAHRDHLSIPIRAGSVGGVTRTVSHGSNSSLNRRRKLTPACKVSSNEFFTVSFECLEPEKGPEEFVPATRGTCLREAISAVCERRGVDIDSINVFLDQSRTPLPLLTSETSWLGGRHIRIRAKDESKSPVRTSGRISVTAPPSRKTSTANNSYRSKSRLFPSSSNQGSGEDNLVIPNNYTNPSSSSYLNQPSPSLSAGLPTSSATLQPSPCGPIPSSFGVIPGSTNVGTIGNHAGLGLASSSSLSNSSSIPAKGKHPNRFSGLFGLSAKENKMGALSQQLDSYSRLGIPKLQHCKVKFEAEDAVEEALYSLEEDWTDVVGHESAQSLDEKTRSQQTALWELVETEVAYIRTLKVIQDLFLNCLCNLQNNHILTEIDVERLFCNIPEIYAANRVFWFDYIIPMLKASRDAIPEGKPLDPTLLHDGFLRFEEIFRPYSRYCSEQTNCQEYCREQDRTNEIFKAYLAWCETQKDCNRLRLIDILVRPMQRLTKYSLLLKAILKKTEDEEQRRILISMDKKVDSFVTFVNAQLRQRQENERLKTIIARIESYDPVETRDEDLERLVSAHCRLDLTSPMPGCTDNQRRNLLFEGDLKLKEGSTKMDVHVFLFSDMLLLCKNLTKAKGDKGNSGSTGHHFGPAPGSANPYGTDAKVKVIRQPYVIDRLVVVDISKDGHSGSQGHSGPGGLALAYLNEYSIVSAAFTLHSSELKIIKVWKEQIQKAKDLYEEAKVASASQIDRFYLSYCGGGNVMSNSATINERMGNLSVQASSELELDSDRDISYRNGGINEKSGSSGLLSAAAASMGGLAAATVRRSSFQGCGNGSSFASNTSNTLTAMLSHPGSVDILDGTTIPGISNEPNLVHQNSSNTLSPFTVAKNPKTLHSQYSYQGTPPTGHNHSRTASMTASMEALRASSQSSEENFCLINKNVQNKATGFSASPSSSRENLGPNVPSNKMSLQIQVSPHQQASFPASPRVDRNESNLIRSSTPNTLSVQVPCKNNDSMKTTVNASHSMPNVSDGQVHGCNREQLQKLHCQNSNSGIDASIQDHSETKDGQEQSSRVSCYKTQTKGASYPPLSPKSLKRCGRVTTQQSSVSGGSNDSNAASQNDTTYSAHKNNFSRKPGLRHQMATVQPEGITTSSCQPSQIIPVITTEGTDESNCVTTSKDTTSVIGIKSNARTRQTGRPGGVPGRYHTTGAIEGIKKSDGDGETIQKRLSLNYGKHMSNSAGGEKLKIKGGVSDASINIEVDSRESSADAGQLSGSTSGVSSACSGSLQQLSGGGVTPEVSDPNICSLTEKCELNAKVGLSTSSSGTSSLGSTSGMNQPTLPSSSLQPSNKNVAPPFSSSSSCRESNVSLRSSTYVSNTAGISNEGGGMNTDSQKVPPPIPPRGNRERETNQSQISNVCHVSTTYIGGSSNEVSSRQSTQQQSPTNLIMKSELSNNQREEVTIGNQSTLSSQVSVSNRQSKSVPIQQTGLQLKISVNSSSSNLANSPSDTSNIAKKPTVTKVSSQSTSLSSNKTVNPRTSTSTRESPKIQKLRDLLLADSDVESSNV